MFRPVESHVKNRIAMMTKAEKLQLADEVLRIAYDNTESYETDGELSADLLYLVAAIIQDDGVDWTKAEERQVFKILYEHCPCTHPVWLYINNGRWYSAPDVPEQPVDEFAAERRLAEYWRKKAGIAFSDFDLILGAAPPADQQRSARGPALDFNKAEHWARNGDVVDGMILRGAPLSRLEFHWAVATRGLLTDLEYEEFFRTKWYETAKRRGYGQPDPEDV